MVREACQFKVGIFSWLINTGLAFLPGLPGCLSNRSVPSQSSGTLEFIRLPTVSHCGDSTLLMCCIEDSILVPHPDSDAKKEEQKTVTFLFPEKERTLKAGGFSGGRLCLLLLPATARHFCPGSQLGVCHTQVHHDSWKGRSLLTCDCVWEAKQWGRSEGHGASFLFVGELAD